MRKSALSAGWRDQVPVSGSQAASVLQWREYCYKRPLLEDREDV